MFLAEKGLPFERVEVDIAAGATGQADFLAINPLGEVPVLELDDGTRLTESLAICRYLESLHPQPPLLGTSPLEQARIESMVLSVMFRLYVPTTHAFRHTHKFWQGRLTQIPSYGELARQQVLDEWQRLDAHLGSSSFMAGEFAVGGRAFQLCGHRCLHDARVWQGGGYPCAARAESSRALARLDRRPA
jgi:glutathione S-transferase